MNSAPQSHPRRARTALALGATILVLAGGYWGWRELDVWRGAPSQERASGRAQGQAPVPVAVAKVQTADFPDYLYGLGTVQPYNSVLIRSRVDGEVQKIAFNEGQTVHAGDLLAQI